MAMKEWKRTVRTSAKLHTRVINCHLFAIPFLWWFWGF